MIRLTLYAKPGCHLCDAMKAVVELALSSRDGISLEEIDILSDPALLTRYELEIPVLMIDGKKAAKYRITEQELTQALAGRGA